MPSDIPEFNVTDLIPEDLRFGSMNNRAPTTMPDVNRSPVFDVRNLGWENISTPVENNVDRALTAAKLNWTVLPRPIIVDGAIVPKRFANVRSDLPPGSNVLEIVGSKYQIVQNAAAFKFVQEIINVGELTLENAGMYNGGKSIFLLGHTEGLTINGEKIVPYLIFSNSHDGSGKVKAALTTMRISCHNAIALALRSAKRVWTVTHTKAAIDQMKAATEAMSFVGDYLTDYPAQVERLMELQITDKQFVEITNRLYPIPAQTKTNKTTVRNATEDHDTFVRVYKETPDLNRWVGTAWGVLGAYTDVISHTEPQRITTTFDQNRFARNMIIGQDVAMAQAVIANVVGATA